MLIQQTINKSLMALMIMGLMLTSYSTAFARLPSVSTSGQEKAFNSSDIATITTRNVDPIPNSVDDEYAEYIITLKSGEVLAFQLAGNEEANGAQLRLADLGYVGSLNEFLSLAKQLTTESGLKIYITKQSGAYVTAQVEFSEPDPFKDTQSNIGTIYWGDGKSDNLINSRSSSLVSSLLRKASSLLGMTPALITANVEHTYAQNGTYTINASGIKTGFASKIIQIKTETEKTDTSFFERISQAFQTAFGKVTALLFPDSRDAISQRDFADLPILNNTEVRKSNLTVNDIEAIIINKGGSSACNNGPSFAFEAYVSTKLPSEIGIRDCAAGYDVTNYLDKIIDNLSKFYGFSGLTVKELLRLPVYLGDVDKDLATILDDKDSKTEETNINELMMEAKVKDSKGATLIDWTNKNISINSTNELAFRWDAKDYNQCLVFFADSGKYSLLQKDTSLRTGNTETAGYDIFERTGAYRIDCLNDVIGSKVKSGLIYVTIDDGSAPHVVKTGVTNGSWSASSVTKVTSQFVDPIPNAVDDEYTEYTITLNNGTVRVVKAANFAPEDNLLTQLQKIGYTGSLNDFRTLIMKTNSKETKAKEPGDVTYSLPSGTISVANTTGNAPLVTTFTVKYYGAGTIFFGDSSLPHELPECVEDSTSTCTQTVTHTYASAGSYSPKLIVSCPTTGQGVASICHGAVAKTETPTITVTQGRVNHTVTNSVGGGGGGTFELNCPSDSMVSAIYGKSGRYLDSISLRCGSSQSTDRAGGDGGDYSYDFSCPSNYEAVGLYGRSGKYVDKIGLVCKNSSGDITRTNEAGGNGGGSFELVCPSDYKADGIFGRSGGWVDRIGVRCVGTDGSATPVFFEQPVSSQQGNVQNDFSWWDNLSTWGANLIKPFGFGAEGNNSNGGANGFNPSGSSDRGNYMMPVESNEEYRGSGRPSGY